MQAYNITDVYHKHIEILNQAAIEPVLITKQSKPSYVIISVDCYHKLLNRLEELEDLLLGQAAEMAVSESEMVGTEIFTSTLEYLANNQAGE